MVDVLTGIEAACQHFYHDFAGASCWYGQVAVQLPLFGRRVEAQRSHFVEIVTALKQ